LFFEKNANIFAENWQKSQKIVVITSTPDLDTQQNVTSVLIAASYHWTDYAGKFGNKKSNRNISKTFFEAALIVRASSSEKLRPLFESGSKPFDRKLET
jgi:hypothetical protein